MIVSSQLEILFPVFGGNLQLPYVSDPSNGLPSGADMEDAGVDLNDLLIKNKVSTFYARAKGHALTEMGIAHGDLLIIDRNLSVKDGGIVACFLDGEYLIRRIQLDGNCCWLLGADPEDEPIRVTYENEFLVWGVVAHVIKSFS